jgi:hypothetical protein
MIVGVTGGCRAAPTTRVLSPSLTRRLYSGVWPGVRRATESRAGHKANSFTAAAVAVGSYRLAGLRSDRIDVCLGYLLAIGLLGRPRLGSWWWTRLVLGSLAVLGGVAYLWSTLRLHRYQRRLADPAMGDANPRL